MTTSFNNPDLMFVEDDHGHRLPYHCQYAENPESAPILISFHGWLIRHRQYQTSTFSHAFNRKDWNYVTPQDRYGLARGGCWYLGEQGNLFFVDLIDQLIADLRKAGLMGPLYFHGTSMGGFGALLHGLRLAVRAICVSVPQVRLLGTELHGEWTRAIEAVFGQEVSQQALNARVKHSEIKTNILENVIPENLLKFSDATRFINTESPQKNPLVFITQSAMDVHKHYVQEQALYLAAQLADAGVAYYLKILPEQAHVEYVNPEQAVSLFERYTDQINQPVVFSTEKYEQDMAEIHQLSQP